MQHILSTTGHALKIPNIIKAEGLYLYDDLDKKYIDLESGIWCTSVGHSNAKINSIMKKQIDSLAHAGFCYSNEIVEKAAKSILQISGFKKGKAIFLSSGSEAVEISRQMSRSITKKQISLTLKDSYLGAYSSFTNKSDWYFFDWNQCKECQEKEKCNLECKLLEEIPKEISEFIFEPGSSSGFVHYPPVGLIQNIVKIVKESGGKIIVNEVTTGVGRTGKWFGFQHYDIKPNFIAVGKGIGNGYPVSISLIDESNAKQLESNGFHYAQSHQNDPLGAAVVEGVIEYIEKNDLILEAEKKGLFFKKQLESLVDDEIVLEVRGKGLMYIIEIKNEDTTNYLYNKLIEKGFIVGNRGQALKLDPALIITKEQILNFVDTFKEVKFN